MNGKPPVPLATPIAPLPRHLLLGGIVAITLLAWLVTRVDWRAFLSVIETTRPEFLLLLVVAVNLELLLRALKWQQLLFILRRVSVLRLFAATSVGYFINLLVPLGLNPLVRSWLIARDAQTPSSSVLATVAVDRTVDGFVFVAIALLVIVASDAPSAGDLSGALALSAVVSAMALALGALLLIVYRRNLQRGTGYAFRLFERLPESIASRLRDTAIAFGAGIAWPADPLRGALIVVISIATRLVAATHFYLAGRAFGVVLSAMDCLAILAIVGFFTLATHLARVPAGYVLGSAFALALFSIDPTTSAAMIALGAAASAVTLSLLGTWGLLLFDVSPRKLVGLR